MRDSSEQSPRSSLPYSACMACKQWGLTVVQIVVAVAVWDLCRIGKVEPTYALAGLVLLAVPGAATLATRVVSAYRGKGE